MAQLFDQTADTYLRLALLAVLLFLIGLATVMSTYGEPRYITAVGWAPDQPVPFSHAHHVDGLGIDCRYCHDTVARSSSAGFPPTHTCMSCHSQVWTQADALEPVRQSYERGEPLRWRRVYDLPEFVFFKHNVHVSAGVGCETCHGRIDQMPLTRQATSLQMEWCLECHREPEKFIRPRDDVYTMGWQPPKDREEMGRRLVEEYGIDTEILTNCSICHH
jgi:hypothetical protein